MPATFSELHHYEELGLSIDAVLVKYYLEKHGPAPAEVIAERCECPVRVVEDAVSQLHALGLIGGQHA